ncbi:hypothetical protein HELRODRAFT_182723 [Helobdella robusta]|uniref:Uncharacterized protein n=1 Tax=Helobdella robusta TaxID=6412 RepID=T1FIN3_HELRO|nr:hypothetical protein HELRODRAFT_182723 [Helobdella robusta]ESN90226.1 hypothetical protein HELRODRAFT_182723 [Helobdella robusta]
MYRMQTTSSSNKIINNSTKKKNSGSIKLPPIIASNTNSNSLITSKIINDRKGRTDRNTNSSNNVKLSFSKISKNEVSENTSIVSANDKDEWRGSCEENETEEADECAEGLLDYADDVYEDVINYENQIGSVESLDEEEAYETKGERKSSYHKLVRWLTTSIAAGDYSVTSKRKKRLISSGVSMSSSQNDSNDFASKSSKIDKDSRISHHSQPDYQSSLFRSRESESKFMQLVDNSKFRFVKPDNEFLLAGAGEGSVDEEDDEEEEETFTLKYKLSESDSLKDIISDDDDDDIKTKFFTLSAKKKNLLDEHDRDDEEPITEEHEREAKQEKGNSAYKENMLLEEDENGNLIHFEEIRANLKTRVFADRTCEDEPKNGEQARRKARGLKFNPALLLSNYRLKDLFTRDENGWAPIHYCAFRGFRQCISIIHNEVPVMIEYRTKDDRLFTTPFLLAVMSLDLETIKLFIALGANLSARDGLDHDAVQLCTYKQAITLIKFFIELDDPRLKVWNILVRSLESENDYDALATAKTLRLLTDIEPPWTASCYWKPLYRKGITKYITMVLNADFSVEVKIESLETILHIIAPNMVKKAAVEKHDILPILIQLCLHENAVIADLSVQCLISILSVGKYLEQCINTNLLGILINSMSRKRQPLTFKNTLDLMALLLFGHSDFQHEFNLIEKSFLQIVGRFNKNKSKMVSFSLVRVVEKLMVATLAAIRAMCKNNPYTQKILINADAVPGIVLLLKKTRYLTIQELTASTLWTIGGKSFQNLWRIAESIGVKVLVEFVESHSEILEFIGADGLAILNSAPLGVHDAFNACSGTQVLTRLMVRTTDRRTLLATIRAIRHSCYKSALIKHPGNQKLAVGDYTVQGCVNLLLDIINSCNFKDPILIKAECIMALGSMALVNTASLQELLNNKSFSFCLAINLLKYEDEDIRALGGQTLAIMCYNMTSTQSEIATFGGIYYCDFKKWMLEAKSDLNKCHFAFQLFTLARVFPDAKPATPAAEGIIQLFEFLSLPSSDDFYKQESITAVLCQACNYIAALCHSRPGVPDSFIAIKTLEHLFNLLTNSFEQTRASAAIACGYLTFHPTAKRWLLRKFRQDTYLLDVLLFYTQDTKCNSVLLENWKYLEYVGLPPKELVNNCRSFHTLSLFKLLALFGRIKIGGMCNLLSEPRPHILTGVEDPHSGVVGTSTVEKDDYEDELVYTDDPPQRKKVISSKSKVGCTLSAEIDTRLTVLLHEPQPIPCLVRLHEERAKKQRDLDEQMMMEKIEKAHDLEEEEEEEEVVDGSDDGVVDGSDDGVVDGGNDGEGDEDGERGIIFLPVDNDAIE